jgi:PhoPQ-activated pathogenicity-related protein
VLIALAGSAPGRSAEAEQNPLKAYVAKPDDSYQWVKRQEREVGGVQFVELTLTSQTWMGTTWKHQLFLARPAEFANAKQGLLLIWGGGWSPELEQPVDEKNGKLPTEATIIAQVVRQLKAPVALLLQVPHQPIEGRTEDDLIAHTFEQYLKTGDKEWPLLFPMVKSAVRAMDAMQEFARQNWDVEIERFTVSGASKRGWTTWLTGVADPRVNAIAPMVIDTLNMPAQMKNQIESWGEYSEQIQDYTRRGLQQQLETPRGLQLSAWVDPYRYLEDLEEPKLLVMGTNDPYWCLDACNFYWNDLPGEKHVLYVPNKGHGVDDIPRLLGTIGALHRQAAGELTLPNLKWDYSEQNGHVSLDITSDRPPMKVVAWTATAPTKDFRQSKWESRPVEQVEGKYQVELPKPAEGYAALFGEAVYREGAAPYYLSTNVKIIGAAEATTAQGGN